MKWWKKGLVVILLVLVSLQIIQAVPSNTIIINSKDWKDVYSGMMYGNIVGQAPDFLTSEPHSVTILNGHSKAENISIFSSKGRPIVFGYESTVKNKGFEKATELKFDSLSVELAKQLKDTKNFIIIDDSYGYNAIAVAPYAMVSKSYVLFADRTNIVEIEDFLDERNPDEILIYGHVDREVLNALKKFNPDIINEDGDRFANNVEIVKRYVQIKEVGQVLLTNGEFIEGSLISGEYPTLFIGKNNVPDKIKEYITNSEINTGVLIGNDLVGTATLIRRQLGISTFVKFARSARAPSGTISQVEDLDLFFVPSVSLNLTILGVRYNKMTKQIEITYENNADIVSYFKGSYTLIEGDNEQTFGDLEPVFIAANSFKTVVYDVQPLVTDSATLDVYSIFGESKGALEFVLEGTFEVSAIDVKDDTKIDILNLYYDNIKKRFVIEVQNTGDKEVFVDIELVDLNIQGEKQTLAADDTEQLKIKAKKNIYIPVVLDEEDVTNNPTIRVRAYYGERRNALVKILEKTFDLAVKDVTFITYVPTAALIILGLLVLMSVTKKKCTHCGHKNHRVRKKCKKCGNDIKAK